MKAKSTVLKDFLQDVNQITQTILNDQEKLVSFIRNAVQEDYLALMHLKMQESKIKTRIPKQINDQVIKHYDDGNPKHKDWKWNKGIQIVDKKFKRVNCSWDYIQGEENKVDIEWYKWFLVR